MSSDQPQTEISAIVACTVSRDVQNFDLLIEDMETALGEAWGDLGFTEALAFFASEPKRNRCSLLRLPSTAPTMRRTSAIDG